MRCLVTGATGFIGQSLVPHLRSSGYETISWPRSPAFDFSNETPALKKWVSQLHNIDSIVHLAGLAHQPKKNNDSSRYFQINRDGTLRLAEAAHAAGVKRFIFMSSAKVFGEGGDAYSPRTPPTPVGAYAQSKWQAEQLLLEKFGEAMEIIILRPPLVYGRNAKANFASLMMLAKLPIPLPIADINNQRSMIGLDNLIDLILVCLKNPDAIGKTLLCADLQSYSLASIVTSIRLAMDRQPNLFSSPRILFAVIKKLAGNSVSNRLFGNFKMDCSETYEMLNWIPPFTMEQILRGHADESAPT